MINSKFIIGLVLAVFLNFQAVAQEVNGIMMVVKGDIKVLSAKGGTEDAGKVGKKVFPGDTIVAGADSRAKIVMSDKNVINVSPDSKVIIEKYQNDGQNKNVELNVVYGKIRASVEQKYDGEKNKFNVRTASAVAGVRGTDFLAGYNPSTKAAQVITFSGTVAVGKPGPGGAILNPVFVQPGQVTQVSEGKPPETPKAMPKEELNKMNNETKAETAKGGQNTTDSSQTKNDKEKDKEKKDSKESVDGEKKADKKSEGDKKTDDKKVDNDKKADGEGEKRAERSGDKKIDSDDKKSVASETKKEPSATSDSGGSPTNTAVSSGVNDEPARGPASTMEGGGMMTPPPPPPPMEMMNPDMGGVSMIDSSVMGPDMGKDINFHGGGYVAPLTPPPQYIPPPMNSGLPPTNPNLIGIIQDQNKNATVQIRIITPSK